MHAQGRDQPRRATALVAFALLLLVASALLPSPVAEAQAVRGSCRSPILAFHPMPTSLPAGGSFNLPFAIENPNGPEVESVRADIKVTTPGGWTAAPARRELTMGPNNVTQNVLAITAPSRGTGAAAGNITVSVTFVCITGVVQRTSAPAEQVFALRITAFNAPWPVVIGAFAVLAVGVGFLGIRRLRRSVGLTIPMRERDIPAGKSAKFTFVVENRRGKPAKYEVLAQGVPEAWGVHMALDTVELEPGEEKTLWAIVKTPAHATPGVDVPIVLRLLGTRGPRDGATGTLLIHVGDPD